MIASIDDVLSGESEEMAAGAPSTTWYFPDGTVIDAGTGEASASAGSSALEFDYLAGSSFDEFGGVISGIEDEFSGQSETVASAPSTTWYYPDGTVVQEGAGEASASAGSSSELDQLPGEPG